MTAFELFTTPEQARHRATLWWGTYNVVFSQLYGRALELQPITMTEESEQGSYVSTERLQRIHDLAVAAATLAHDGPPYLPSTLFPSKLVKEG